jgi:hypothetical protein
MDREIGEDKRGGETRLLSTLSFSLPPPPFLLFSIIVIISAPLVPLLSSDCGMKRKPDYVDGIILWILFIRKES